MSNPRIHGWIVAILLLVPIPTAAADTRSKEIPIPPTPSFSDQTLALGVTFEHRFFGTGMKWMPENMGAGVAVFDANNDGRLDLYFVQGAPLDGSADPTATNRLWHQRANGTFIDATEQSGLGDRGYGMGAVFGDIDSDGDADVYVTNFGPDRLYRNRGDGTFEDITAAAGVSGDGWSTGATFFDAEGDGDLDIYIVGYLDFTLDRHKWCGNAKRGIRSYCHPDVYNGAPDHLYRNRGDGTFEDVSQSWGLRRSADDKGLGVVSGDFDNNGRQDLYVANDSTMNYLYLATGEHGYEESALFAGLGFNGAGKTEASMGIARGDLDGDSRPEIFLTHLDRETNTLYRPDGDATWVDATEASGLAAPSLPWVGFGTVFFDPDHDGDLDIAVVNGHIIDNIELFDPSRSHRQPAQYFANQGWGRFRDHSDVLGLVEPIVGRGLVAADLDQDGDPDLVLTQNGGPAKILLNQTQPALPSLVVRLRGATSNSQGFGARVSIESGGRIQVRELTAASSYLSQGPPEIHFGLGALPADKTIVDKLVVTWPSGQTDTHKALPPGAVYTFREGSPEVTKEIFEPAPPAEAKSPPRRRPEAWPRLTGRRDRHNFP